MPFSDARMEWTGLLTEGEICSLNGSAFSVPKDALDMTILFAVGDVVAYPSGSQYRITFVDPDTVRMKLISEESA